MKKHVAVALSGGIDSAVAAALLKKDNHQVIALHFRTGYESPFGGTDSSDPPSSLDSWAESVAAQIDIPFEIVDCSKVFESDVVSYFVDAYRSGQTPNPCMVCNQRIKFGFMLEEAKARGASTLATGHYARIQREENGRFCLTKGVDPEKDQSYFLALLNQEQLSRASFPLGTYTKKEVREMAASFSLTSFRAGESQELCFVGEPNYKEFLSKHVGLPSKPGAIVNTTGDVIGHHNGLHAFTVIGIEPPDKPISVNTRIRYRHQEAGSTLTPLDDRSATVRFSESQYAITPGQAAVFYQGERVLGGGWIE